MWSGKSGALLARVRALRDGGVPVLLVAHAADTRAAAGGAVVASRGRGGVAMPADASLHSLDDLALSPAPVAAYAVDEGQFFGDSLLRLAARLARERPRSQLLVAGLDLDYGRAPFGATLRLASEALGGWGAGAPPFYPDGSRARPELLLRRLTARCAHTACSGGAVCSAPAPFTQRLVDGGDAVVLVGGASFYRPACEAHHSPVPVPAAGPGGVWAECDDEG
jgi:thymidine kinase